MAYDEGRFNPTRRGAGGHAWGSTSIHLHRTPSAVFHLFYKCTQGHFFNCLASDHRASNCNSTACCFDCRRFRHRLCEC